MKSVVYLQFKGQAAEALSFYKDALKASNFRILKFGDFNSNENVNLSETEKDMVMESYIEFSGNILMISDVPDFMQPVVGDVCVGSNVLISIIGATDEENKEYFKNLAQGGRVIMPISKTPWSSSFGMLVDRFGVMWKFNTDADKFVNM